MFIESRSFEQRSEQREVAGRGEYRAIAHTKDHRSSGSGLRGGNVCPRNSSEALVERAHGARQRLAPLRCRVQRVSERAAVALEVQ
jgi:hypothetical protein